MSEPIPPKSPKGISLANFALLRPLYVRNFLLLWVGSALSSVGSQLTLIAFPWLVLKISGDALAMGTVLALAGIPRAVFMLFGGAFTDRFSPRTVMLWVNWLRMFLMFMFAFLVYARLIEMWMVYLLAFMFGVIDAFFWPASSALVPRLIKPELLPAGNSLIQGMGQLSLMVGPVVAGLIIALFAEGQVAEGQAGDTADLPGIAVVFLIDGIGFAVAIMTLVMMRLAQDPDQHTSQFTLNTLGRSIVEGFVAMWRDIPIRVVVLAFTTFSLFFRGPYLVGIPLLSDARFPEGALAFGMISSAFGVGSLIGLVLAGSLPRPGLRWYGYFIMADILVIGIGMIGFAYSPTVEWAMVVSAITGVTDGYIVIILVSWIQERVPPYLMGRVMSMIMFFMQGVTPVSAAAAGALFRFSVEGVFIATGIVLLVVSTIGISLRTVRRMDEAPNPYAHETPTVEKRMS